MTTTPELLAALRSWLADQAPGLVPSHISVHFFNHPTPMQLPFGPAIAPPAPTEDDGNGRRHSKCIDDILDVLTKAKKPLTTTLILSELAKAGKEWSERYVSKLLAEMVRDGTLDNPSGVRPRGYRLADVEYES